MTCPLERPALFLAPLIICLSLGGALQAENSGLPEKTDGAKASVNQLSRIDSGSLTGFRDRPLFLPSRTRPEDVQPEDTSPAQSKATETLDITLLGIVVGPDEKAAFVLDIATDQRIILHIGGFLYGWRVASIDPDRGLTLIKGDMPQTFTLFRKN